ncbi:MAG: rfbA5 [Betaproteobacteria bacterium]|jgi:teichoic acid transport system permease protein|nr:rfbA5 [Betaproteobacteria bacterium]
MLVRSLRYIIHSVVCFARDLAKNRRLVMQLAVYELRNRYASTMIGALWAIIHPLLTITVFWYVATRGLKVSFTTETPFVLLMFAGFVPWLLFADGISGATNSITNYSYMVRKVAFPVHILPAVPICASLFVHAAVFSLLLVILAWYGRFPRLEFLAVLYYLAALILFTLGLGWLLSALHVFSRDVGQALTTVLTLLFWVTPILWPAQNIGGWAKLVLQLNPLYFIVEGYRSALLTEHAHPFGLWPLDLYFWTVTIVLLAVGASVFRRVEGDFGDVLS